MLLVPNVFAGGAGAFPLGVMQYLGIQSGSNKYFKTFLKNGDSKVVNKYICVLFIDRVFLRLDDASWFGGHM